MRTCSPSRPGFDAGTLLQLQPFLALSGQRPTRCDLQRREIWTTYDVSSVSARLVRRGDVWTATRLIDSGATGINVSYNRSHAHAVLERGGKMLGLPDVEDALCDACLDVVIDEVVHRLEQTERYLTLFNRHTSYCHGILHRIVHDGYTYTVSVQPPPVDQHLVQVLEEVATRSDARIVSLLFDCSDLTTVWSENVPVPLVIDPTCPLHPLALKHLARFIAKCRAQTAALPLPGDTQCNPTPGEITH